MKVARAGGGVAAARAAEGGNVQTLVDRTQCIINAVRARLLKRTRAGYQQIIELSAEAVATGEPIRVPVLPGPDLEPFRSGPSHVYHDEAGDWWTFGDNSGEIRLRPIVRVKRKNATADVRIEGSGMQWHWVVSGVVVPEPAADAAEGG